MVDPLSEGLNVVNARSMISGRIVAGGSWALRFPKPEKLKFYAITKGGCWLKFEGERKPVRFETGDVLLLMEPRGYTLASDLSAKVQEARAVVMGGKNSTTTLGRGDELELLGGHVTLDPSRGKLLLEALPPRIHLKGASPDAQAVQRMLEQLSVELRSERAGAQLAASLLTQLVVVQLLRAHLATNADVGNGWLRALSDKRIAPALQLMHAEPSRDWQLGELAKASSMSRTTFAERFKQSAGVAPVAYLVQWRMRLAERALTEQDVSIAELASSLGYSSESAFSNAFKRVTGKPPRRFRVETRAEASSH